MLTITLLGTAATMPLPDRALTAALAECGGHALLFDCGEGTQAYRGMLRCWRDYYNSDNIPPYRTAHGHRASRDRYKN